FVKGLYLISKSLRGNSIDFNSLQRSDWYRVRRKALEARGAGPLFQQHPSLESALRQIYPEFPWHPSQFLENVEDRDRRNEQKLLDSLDMAEKHMGITQVSLSTQSSC